MPSSYTVPGQRRAAVLVVILGLHVGAFLLVSAALRWAPVTLPELRRVITFVRTPLPEPAKATQPERAAAADYNLPLVEFPRLDIPDFERAFQVPDGAAGRLPGGLGPERPAAVARGPRLRTRDAGLQAVIDACYPASARRLGQQGRGVALLVVDTAGGVRSWTLEDSAGSAALDNGIGCVVRRLQFEPAQRDGRPIESTARMPVVFRLR
jgi:TonB family protein